MVYNVINLSNIDHRIQQVNVPWSSVKIISRSERELLKIVTYNNYFWYKLIRVS